jgi:hypothetical protein
MRAQENRGAAIERNHSGSAFAAEAKFGCYC